MPYWENTAAVGQTSPHYYRYRPLASWLVCTAIIAFMMVVSTPGYCSAYSWPLDFKPPAGDTSVTFLGDLFGVVDGVLSGSGSQIAGVVFGVFNTALLALGGIVVIYTTFISAMNSSNEGQFMGQRWSSVWIPVRTIAGVTLVLPKSTGYCVMQIVMMWLVVEGVGAADKIWSGALDYMDSGGAIIEPSSSESSTSDMDSGTTAIYNGAYGILVGQVCMYALQKVLTDYQTELNDSSSDNVCDDADGVSSSNSLYSAYQFCTGSIPNFLESIDLVSANDDSTTTYVAESMPDFDSDSDGEAFSELNGTCGWITFKQFSTSGMSSLGLSSSEESSLSSARADALQAMYNSLESTAKEIVLNAPSLNSDISCNSKCSNCANCDYAKEDLGTPLSLSLGYCTPSSDLYDSDGDLKDSACISWDVEGGSKTSILLDGTEIQDAVSTYNGTISPALTLQYESSNASTYNSERDFIDTAKNTGWLMAGGYYFKLAILSSQVLQNSGAAGDDTDSGIKICGPKLSGVTTSDTSVSGCASWKTTSFKDLFSSCDYGSSSGGGDGVYRLYCIRSSCNSSTSTCVTGDSAAIKDLTDPIDDIATLIDGDSDSTIPSISSSTQYIQNDPTLKKAVYGTASSASDYSNTTYTEPNSVYGYVINATDLGKIDSNYAYSGGDYSGDLSVSISKVSAISSFPSTPSWSVDISDYDSISKSGGRFKIPGKVVKWVYNDVWKPIANTIIGWFTDSLNALFSAIVDPMSDILTNAYSSALKVMKNENTNPIIALTNVGVNIIENTGKEYLEMTGLVCGYALFPPALAVVMIVLPLLVSWMSIMYSLGCTLAFLIPLQPYMMFTFASISWLFAVIESMVAAPIVALGLMHPEGNDALGKADQAVMLSLNVFLRPAMMVLGYLFGIMLSYVGIWLVNEGFDVAIPAIEDMPKMDHHGIEFSSSGSTKDVYGSWTGYFLYFFVLIIYVTTLITVTKKSFEMIYYLPDKVLRWLSNGATENFGEGVAKNMAGEVQKIQTESVDTSNRAMAKTQTQLQGKAAQGAAMIRQLAMTAIGGEAGSAMNAVMDKEMESGLEQNQPDEGEEEGNEGETGDEPSGHGH